MPLTFRDRLLLALDARLNQDEIEDVLDELAEDLKEISTLETLRDMHTTLTVEVTGEDTKGTLMPVTDPNASFNLPK
jgi:hypothetical protein